MAIWNLGSINADHFYAVPCIPGPGETIAATTLTTGLGGKGANQSVAAARAGSVVHHIGAVGPDGAWARDRLAGYGVHVTHVAESALPTGHAVIMVAEDGENSIVILDGANADQPEERIGQALSAAVPGDTLVLQNETTGQAYAARLAKDRGMRVIYSAAPFSVDAVREMLPLSTMVLVNELEAEQLTSALGLPVTDLPVPEIVITKGSDGAVWVSTETKDRIAVPAQKVTPVDTTGAGDTFAGYLVAGLDQGLGMEDAMVRASAAAALKVTRPGTADAIPAVADVDAFVAGRA